MLKYLGMYLRLLSRCLQREQKLLNNIWIVSNVPMQTYEVILSMLPVVIPVSDFVDSCETTLDQFALKSKIEKQFESLNASWKEKIKNQEKKFEKDIKDLQKSITILESKNSAFQDYITGMEPVLLTANPRSTNQIRSLTNVASKVSHL